MMQYHPSGADLRELREKADLTQNQLAARLSCLPNAAFKFEVWSQAVPLIEVDFMPPYAGELLNYLAACGYEDPPPLDDAEEAVYRRGYEGWIESQRPEDEYSIGYLKEHCEAAASAALRAHRRCK